MPEFFEGGVEGGHDVVIFFRYESSYDPDDERHKDFSSWEVESASKGCGSVEFQFGFPVDVFVAEMVSWFHEARDIGWKVGDDVLAFVGWNLFEDGGEGSFDCGLCGPPGQPDGSGTFEESFHHV